MSKNASADLYRQKSTAPTEQVSRLCTHNKINTGGFFTVVTLAAIQFHTVLDSLFLEPRMLRFPNRSEGNLIVCTLYKYTVSILLHTYLKR